MSRIAGCLGPEASDRASRLAGMLASLPSGEGWRCATASSGRAALGWCGWHTPNAAEDHGVIAVMDGCLYNRTELPGTPQTSDAQRLVLLYRRHGMEETLRRLNGDFAVALYDAAVDTLWVACDRFGIKPLYYVVNQDGLSVASQPRALLTLPGVSRDVNRQFVALFAASHYRYFDNQLEQSPYADIARLPGAHVLRFQGAQATVGRYWALEPQQDWTDAEEVLAERYRALFLDAVSLRRPTIERPVFTLSGGMDSASVLAAVVHVSGTKQEAVSVVYRDNTYDESAEIQAMLEPTVSRWHRVAVETPDVFGLIRRMIEVHDEPVATATWLSHFLLCEAAAKEGFTGCFGGLGGDELNAGEYEHFWPLFADLRAQHEDAQLAEEVRQWVRYHNHPIFRKSAAMMEERLPRLADLTQPGRCLPDRLRLERYAATLNLEYFNLRTFEPVMDHPFSSYLKNRTYQDLTREAIPCCLRAEDRQMTAFSLDNALPFFDHRLVEFMFRVPGTLKIRHGLTKYLLREAMRGILPEATRTRVKKTGWNAPAHLWFSGAGREALLDLVQSRAFRARGIYDLKQVHRVIEEHERIVSDGRPEDNHMMFLWQLVNLEVWLQWLEARPPVQGHGDDPRQDRAVRLMAASR